MMATAPRISRAEIAALESTLCELVGLNIVPTRDRRPENILNATLTETGLDSTWDLLDQVRAEGIRGDVAQCLIRNSTTGETCFFRHAQQIDALRNRILPEIIERHRHTGKRLRIWSAACSTGEELYTVGILLRELLPDFSEWHITLLGTDICQERMKAARAGIYSDWSFRETPDGVRARHFTRRGSAYELTPEIKTCARFQHLNLSADLPVVAGKFQNMDLILARNVIAHLDPVFARLAVERFETCLKPGGALLFAPNDVPHLLGTGLEPQSACGALYYTRNRAASATGAAASASETVDGVDSVEQEQLARIRQLTDARDFDLALEAWESNAAALLTVPEFHLLGALIQIELGNIESALNELDATLILDQDNAFGLVLKAVCMHRLGHDAASRGWAEKVRLHLDTLRDDECVTHIVPITAGECRALLSGVTEYEVSCVH